MRKIKALLLAGMVAASVTLGAGPAQATHSGPFIYSDPGNIYPVQGVYWTHNSGVGIDTVYPGEHSVRGIHTIRPYNGQRVVITYQSLVTGKYYYTTCGGTGAVGNSVEVEGVSPC